jgi:hypothetical protein
MKTHSTEIYNDFIYQTLVLFQSKNPMCENVLKTQTLKEVW